MVTPDMASTASGLKALVSNRIINHMLRCDSARKKGKGDWKVLVMDHLATRIISASCRMHEVMAEGITIVEDVYKSREPLPQLEAVYFISPNQHAIERVIADFEHIKGPLYKAAHIFFTSACSDEQFSRISKSKVAKYTKTLRELNIAFVPYERQVFTLDSPNTLNIVYNPAFNSIRSSHFEHLADQISTLCATLQEYPTIRYRTEFSRNSEFAHILQAKLDQHKSDDPTMGERPDKKSILLLVDRGFDPVTPLLHDLTLQSMAYDLLPIVSDVYTYNHSSKSTSAYTFDSSQLPSDNNKEVLLGDGNVLWPELRHQHIATASQLVTKKLKDFAAEKRIKDSEKTNIKDLSQMVKRLPQYQKEISAYSIHLHLIEDCMKQYQGKLDKVCLVEQNLVMGTDSEGEKIKDPMKHIVPILLDASVSIDDKLRVIIIYILYKNGITAENLEKLLGHAMIPAERKGIIMKLQMLNLQIVQDAKFNSRKRNIPQIRKDRSETVYQTSRWTPYIKDLMEAAIEDKLDSKMFGYVGQKATMVALTGARVGFGEYGGWHRGRNQSFSRSGPRLIVFILGGLTYPEMRCAYEVSSACNNQANIGVGRRWEVMIGSDHVITPKDFLHELKMEEPSSAFPGASSDGSTGNNIFIVGESL